MKQQNILLALLKLLGIVLLSSLVWVFIFAMMTPDDIEGIQEPFNGSVFIFGSLTVVILHLGMSYNKVRHLEQRANALWSNIEVIADRNSKLLDKANRFVDKHQDREKDNLVDIMQSAGKTTKKEVYNPLKGKQIESSQEFGQFLKGHPDLLANENVERLLQAIFDTENQLAQARVDYNTAVELFNSMIHQLPISLIGRLLQLQDKAYYQLPQTGDDITDEMLGL